MNRENSYANKCMKACAGLPYGALDGGWTALGIIQYTAQLEKAIEPFAKHPEFHAPDDWPVTIIRREPEPDGKPIAGVTAGDFRRAKTLLYRHFEKNDERTI